MFVVVVYTYSKHRIVNVTAIKWIDIRAGLINIADKCVSVQKKIDLRSFRERPLPIIFHFPPESTNKFSFQLSHSSLITKFNGSLYFLCEKDC